MTGLEFSSQFDTLYNNITSNQAPGLNDYEKSVFLTKAQYELLNNYFNASHNPNKEGFDNTRKRKLDFSPLVKVCSPTLLSNAIETAPSLVLNIASMIYTLPNSVSIFSILNEQITYYEVKESNMKTLGTIQLIPLDLDEYTKLMSKPYKEPLKNQGWVMENSSVEITDNQLSLREVILNTATRNKYYNFSYTNGGIVWSIKDGVHSTYVLKYVEKPLPIIITDLTAADYYDSDLSIEGKVGNSSSGDVNPNKPCSLNEVTQQEILQRAVELAKIAWEADLKTTVQIGQRSE